MDRSALTTTVLHYCEHLDPTGVVPAQVPLLIEFLCICNIGKQLSQITPGSRPPVEYPGDLEPLSSGLRGDLDCVYLLSRCFFYNVFPPPVFIREALVRIGKQWSAVTYTASVECFRRFTKKLDVQVVGAFTQHCLRSVDMVEYPIAQFALSEDDRARYYALSSFSDREVRLRLALFQFYNTQLNRVVHLVELINSKKNQSTNSLGTYISGLTGYIFPCIKENFLELSISQTTYHGKDAYPIVELDNRRVYTDMERSDQLGGNGETHSVMTSQCFFMQLFRQMQQYSVDVMRAPLDARERLLSVKYKGEQGLDWGGLYRDTIERW